MMVLAEYLSMVARRRFGYGALDCCTFMADWLVACGLPDPMADRRGTYRTYQEYRHAMREEGGIVRSCERRFASIGLETVDAPKPGDVCLVRISARLRNGKIVVVPTGAIAVTEKLRAVVTGDAGLLVFGLGVVRAWSHANAASRPGPVGGIAGLGSIAETTIRGLGLPAIVGDSAILAQSCIEGHSHA